MKTQVTVTDRTAGTSQAVIGGHVPVPGEAGHDQARQAWNLASGRRSSVAVPAGSPAGVVPAVQFARTRDAHGSA